MGIYFVRHAQTNSNNKGVFMGTIDCDIEYPISLSSKQSLQQELALIEPFVVFSSPLKRCIQTLQEVLPGKEYISDGRVREKYLGDWQGRNKKEVLKEFPQFFNEEGAMDITNSPETGENFLDFRNRIENFINDISKQYKDNNVVVFTHGGVIAVALYALKANVSTQHIYTKSIEHLKLYRVL